jgi:hypothetical protein
MSDQARTPAATRTRSCPPTKKPSAYHRSLHTFSTGCPKHVRPGNQRPPGRTYRSDFPPLRKPLANRNSAACHGFVREPRRRAPSSFSECHDRRRLDLDEFLAVTGRCFASWGYHPFHAFAHIRPSLHGAPRATSAPPHGERLDRADHPAHGTDAQNEERERQQDQRREWRLLAHRDGRRAKRKTEDTAQTVRDRSTSASRVERPRLAIARGTNATKHQRSSSSARSGSGAGLRPSPGDHRARSTSHGLAPVAAGSRIRS